VHLSVLLCTSLIINRAVVDRRLRPRCCHQCGYFKHMSRERARKIFLNVSESKSSDRKLYIQFYSSCRPPVMPYSHFEGFGGTFRPPISGLVSTASQTASTIFCICHCPGACMCMTVYKCLYGSAPKYLAELCVPVADVAGRRQLRSASRGLLNFPRYNMPTCDRRAFRFAGPHVWNLLPEHIRQSI